jgi:hypothetical protein
MNKHSIPKTPQEKSNFKRYIRELDYEPTMDERFKFSESDIGDKDFSISQALVSPSPSGISRLKDYFSENWIAWLVGGVVIILTFLMIESKVDLAKLFEKVDQNKEEINSVKEDVKTINEVNHNQDLKIQEIQIRHEQQKEYN